MTEMTDMQIDIGFGDIVYPEPERLDLPTMLNSPAPRLLCYSRDPMILGSLKIAIYPGQ